MMIEGLPNGRIYEINFAYNSKMEIYPNLTSYIPKLSAIGRKGVDGNE